MPKRKRAKRRTVVTERQLIDELLKLDGGTMATLILETVPVMKKTAANGDENPWWNVGDVRPKVRLRKLARVSGFLGQPYEKAVQNAQKKADPDAEPFKAGPRAWGTKHPDASLVEYHGHFDSDFYLDFRAQRILAVEYRRQGTGTKANHGDVMRIRASTFERRGFSHARSGSGGLRADIATPFSVDSQSLMSAVEPSS